MFTSNDLESGKNAMNGACKTVFGLDASLEQTQTLRKAIVNATWQNARMLFGNHASNEKHRNGTENLYKALTIHLHSCLLFPFHNNRVLYWKFFVCLDSESNLLTQHLKRSELNLSHKLIRTSGDIYVMDANELWEMKITKTYPSTLKFVNKNVINFSVVISGFKI